MMERSCSKKITREVEYSLVHEFGLEPNTKIAVGLSGGLDSVCLLHILLELGKTRRYRMVAVHINHGIRGEEALRDEVFVRELCERWQVENYTYHVDSVAKSRKDRLSIEEAARELRYSCFEKALEDSGAERLALAHHADDSVETFLLNLVRGSGLKGLIGIPKFRGRIIRPLLQIGRDELAAYACEHSLDYVTDSTNDDNTYTRNRIRNLIIPELCEHVNSSAVRHIRRTMEELEGVYEMVSRTVKSLRDDLVLSLEKEYLVLHREKLKTYDLVAASYAISFLADEAGLSKKNWSRLHYRAILDLATSKTGKRISLPSGIEARAEYNRLIIERKEPILFAERSGIEISFADIKANKEFSVNFNGWEFRLEYRRHGENLHFEENSTEYFDLSALDEKSPLMLRYREAEDYMMIDGKGSRKKLARIFIDRKVPERRRDDLPLFVQGNRVLYIPTIRRSRDSWVVAETEEILGITMIKESMGKYDEKRE